MSTDEIQRLFLEYTHLRQTDRTRDEAWDDITAAVDALSSRDRARLLKLLREWEADEGRQYKHARKADLFATHFESAAGADRLNAGRPDSSAGSDAGSHDLPPVVAPSAICPHCHTANAPDATYCSGCGIPLHAVPAQPARATQPVTSGDSQDAFFGEGMVLYLRVGSAQQMIRVIPRHDDMVIGRSSTDSVMLPDVDLAPFQGDTLGVSRLHAGLRRHGDTLVLTDLGSLNHTYINGQRLHVHEVRVLHDGDELRFGHLVVRVYFRQE